MRIAILCFAAGIWLVQQQAELPEWRELVGLLAIALAAAVLAGLAARRLAPAAHVLLAVAAFSIGFGYAGARAQWRLADELPIENEGRDIAVTGVVASLPQEFERGLRFEFEVEQAQAQVPSRLSLAWYRGWREEEWHRFHEVHAGERWRLTVRLKRPHGNMNPHGFDFEAWLFEQGLRATGYVRSPEPNERLDTFVPSFGNVVERLRESIRSRFQAALPEAEFAGVLVALVVGDQRAIDGEQWQLFARTGTTHLMSISGLHVTMFAGLAYWLVGGLWRRVPGLALRLPAQQAAVLAGWLAAFAYSLLAGFAVPAQRTVYMLSVVAAALWLRRTTATSRVLALSLLVVLLLDPWAVLSAGFWLSFGAVALLFYSGSGRVAKARWLEEWGRAQWAVTLGMIPALLALFQQFSLVSPLANAVAIPAVSLVVTPLALLAAVIPFEPLLVLAHWITALLMSFLAWLAHLPVAVWQQAAPPAWSVVVATAGCVWLLLPRGFPARWAGAVLMLPLVALLPERPAPGELRLAVLDVGQGLAVHLQTPHHDLLYDAGPEFSPDANSGNRIILPYLRALGVQRLDGFVISHQDKDHAGGAQSVLDVMPVGWLVSSLPDDDPLRAAALPQRRCIGGEAWDWDGVRFELLHPAQEDYEHRPAKSNDMSCVLKVSGTGGSALLTGDIEAATEARLVAAGSSLRSDYLVAPHHGSRSSSTAEFVAAVGAHTVVFSVGYLSRFHHPHPVVAARYAASGAGLLRTDRDGAITLDLAPGGAAIVRERERSRRYWQGR